MSAATIVLVVPRTLTGLVGDERRHRLEVTGPTTVGELLDQMACRYPVFDRRLRDETGALRRYVNVYVDGDDVRGLAGPATPVAPGQEVQIISSVAGG